MLETLGSVTGTPWIYGIIGTSVLLDVFLPLLPSGVLVVTAATTAAGTTAAGAEATGSSPHLLTLLFLVLSATAASVVGDLVAYRLAWRGGDRFDRAITRSRRLTNAQARLGQALVRGGGVLVVLARFAPAGRSVVSLTAGVAHRRAKDFVPWSALAGLTWAAYSVGLGYFGGRWLAASWLGTGLSVLALCAAGSLAALLLHRRGPQPAGRDTAVETADTVPVT